MVIQMDGLENSLAIAYFCRNRLERKGLEAIRKSIGEEEFKKSLELLEKSLIIEYPMFQPCCSEAFPRGVPYPGKNYSLINYIFFPDFPEGYKNQLAELKKIMASLGITDKIIENSRKQVSRIKSE
jgi:hypothetical protein